jgi:hypothetical protein
MKSWRRFTSTAAVAVTLLAVALSVPPLRSLIEQSMVWHMVVQMPLLALGGWLLMSAAGHWPQHQRLHQPRPALTRWATQLGAWNRYGLTGFIAALMVFAYWMLPLTLDRAVVLPTADALKVISLLAAGALLRHSFTHSPAVLQLFFMGSAVPMAMWLGSYFASTDLRLCNAYSLQSQVNTGWSLAALAAALGALWLLGVVRDGQGKSDWFSA